MKKVKNRITAFVALLLLGCVSFYGCEQKSEAAKPQNDPTDGPAYLNYNLPVNKRVADLVSRLTLNEKSILLNHRGPEIGRFGIKSDGWNQCLHGVWWDRPTTMFPIPTAMAATWDTALVKEEATAISDEARAIYNGWNNDPNFKGEHKGLIYRDPVVNMGRNPYWGRNDEIWGEDPFLTGKMGVAFVKGMQGDDPKYLKLVATLKHYAVNNVEQERHKLSATVNERMLHEYWLPQFRDCIVEGQAQSIMASYNAINDVPNVINTNLLTNILKKSWGFKGIVVSDLGGVRALAQDWGSYQYNVEGNMNFEKAVAKSITAGCDFSDREFMEYVPPAVNDGLLSKDRLDDAVSRVLRARFRLGEFDPPEMVPYSSISPDVIGNAEHIQLALKAAQKSMVLLKNDQNFLPLNKDKLKTIAVIGPHAATFTAGGYSGIPMDPVTPLQGIKNRAASGTKILHAIGGEIGPAIQQSDVYINQEDQMNKAVEIAKKADVAIVYIGTNTSVESEGHDRTKLGLPGNQRELVEKVVAANPKTVVVLMNAGPLTIPWIKDHTPAIIEAWWAGEQGGNAIADAIFGNINPGGHLPYTVYQSESQVPSQDEYNVSKGFTYMYLNGKPLFPFGFGLSYTKFEYSDLEISPAQAPKDGQFTIRVLVKNIGQRVGDEVVQLYVHNKQSQVIQPKKELRGFNRLGLNPGETKTVTFNLPAQKLSHYDEHSHQFVVNSGSFDIMVGSSSEDIRQKGQIIVSD